MMAPPPRQQSRQAMLGHIQRAEATEQAIAVLGHRAKIAVQLLVPIGNPTGFRQILDLVDVATAQAAAVAFLQGHHIVTAQQRGNAIEIFNASPVGQNMLPAAGDVVVIGSGIDAHLNIEGQQADVTMGLEVRYMVHARAGPTRWGGPTGNVTEPLLQPSIHGSGSGNCLVPVQVPAPGRSRRPGRYSALSLRSFSIR